ncbi:hypothetical protein QQM39_26185 [Streptomyces sp. DT2A-34]|uniref:hypothetical protein n=1 Tax=Streptomyces sp. DT2A-34 TaxID=3051182 RepID=UPI00265C89D2|nr:hypothetical protein [Streptomyces sp. DT2A-34]MDO0914191.1 hypothetical protein [Streptomyces sp. DT2A-34]
MAAIEDYARWRESQKPFSLFFLGLDWRTWDGPVPPNRWVDGVHYVTIDGEERPVNMNRCERR